MCGAEREKDCPAQADSTAFILHATADKALVLPDRGHKSPLGDAVPTAYTIPDDKHTIIHTAQHFFSPLSLGLAGAQVTTRGSEETCKAWKSAGTVGRSRDGRRYNQAIPMMPAAVEGTRATRAAAGEVHREERLSRGRSSPAERAAVGKAVIFTRCRMELGQLQGGMGLGRHHQHAGPGMQGHALVHSGEVFAVRVLLTQGPRALGEVASAAGAGPAACPALSGFPTEAG